MEKIDLIPSVKKCGGNYFFTFFFPMGEDNLEGTITIYSDGKKVKSLNIIFIECILERSIGDLTIEEEVSVISKCFDIQNPNVFGNRLKLGFSECSIILSNNITAIVCVKGLKSNPVRL